MLCYGYCISPCLVVQAAASASARPLLHCCQQVKALQHEHAARETVTAAIVWMHAHSFVDPQFLRSAWRILYLLLHMLWTAEVFV
jgi:L-arabinose isomerase